ncbi:MAG TPA: DUF4410 domain-containing protein [Candidatus Angelobacter sp.]
MSAKRLILPVLILLISVCALAKDKPRYKSVEVKHFTQVEGVELSPQFADFLYAELKTELKKSGMFEEILTEDEVVDPADAERSLVVDGSVLEYKKGSVAKEVIIGFGAGRRSLRAQLSVQRRSNQGSLLQKELKVRTSSRVDEKLLARQLAKSIVREMKDQLKG